jgi:CubicO group peptidase (beta-lactamase class C family)
LEIRMLGDTALGAKVTRREFLVAGAAAAALAGCAAHVPTHDISTNADPLMAAAAVLRGIIQQRMIQRDIPGLSIALLTAERVAWVEGFGYTDRTRTTAVTPDTPFCVGSVSKSLTALGILTAQRDNQLTLDDPVVRHLPWLESQHRSRAGSARDITIRHLLSHHAGLGTWPPLGNPYDPDYHARTFDEVASSIAGSRLKFPAGARFEYSNQGIVLAGAALQAATGKSFEQYMREAVLQPLGMTASTFDQRQVTARADFAKPYSAQRATPVRNGIVHAMTPAGGLVSTANDLARFVAFHLRGGGRQLSDSASATSLDPRLLAEMYAPQFSAKDRATGYGLGIYRALQHGSLRLSHGGLGFGVSAHIRWVPEHDLGVVVLTNQDSAHNAPALADDAVALVLRARLGRLPARPSHKSDSVTVPRASLGRLTGSYLLYDGILLRFDVKRGALQVRAGQNPERLDTLSETEFATGGRRYRFQLDGSGAARSVEIVDTLYDPSTAENSVLWYMRNDAVETTGINTQHLQHVGTYRGTFIDSPADVRISAHGGALYVNGTIRLTADQDGTFVMADGEPVIFDGDRVIVANKPFQRR